MSTMLVVEGDGVRDGDYDRFELKLQQPEFRYGIDLNARVEFGIISNVRSFDLVLAEEHNSLYLPKLGTDGVTEEIVDHFVPPNVSVEFHGDPTIIERTETANELVIEPDSGFDSQGFVFLPSEGPLNPNGEHMEDWMINTLGRARESTRGRGATLPVNSQHEEEKGAN